MLDDEQIYVDFGLFGPIYKLASHNQNEILVWEKSEPPTPHRKYSPSVLALIDFQGSSELEKFTPVVLSTS